MPHVLVNRSIVLSRTSKEAWSEAGATVLSRKPVRLRRQLERLAGQQCVLLNLGLPASVPRGNFVVYNDAQSVRSIVTPGALRRTMPDVLPPVPKTGQSYWHKGPGQHGRNKIFMRGYANMEPDWLDRGWDNQLHIEGTQYRVVTVGDKVVQAFRKEGDRHPFEWFWVALRELPRGTVPVVKQAVGFVPNGERTVIGWDVIVGDKPYIIEGNSSPGVNAATAERILRQIGVTNG